MGETDSIVNTMRAAGLILFVLLNTMAFAQNAEPVAGTRVSLIPPKGFTAATNFSGFWQQETGASIMVSEIPGSAKDLANEFTAEKLSPKGMTFISRKTVTANNQEATLVHVSQAANGQVFLKQVLICGDENMTILVNGIYPQSAKQLEKEILASVLSSTYNQSQSLNASAAIEFTIDAGIGGLQFAKVISGTMAYTPDGLLPSKSPNKIFLTAGGSLGNKVAGDQSLFATERLKKLPGGASLSILEQNEIEIDGLKGFEIVAESPEKFLTYQVMLFTEAKQYYMIVGKSETDTKGALENFRKIARTFKLK